MSTSLYHSNCDATRSLSHSQRTRSETFLHTLLTIPMGFACADTSTTVPYSVKLYPFLISPHLMLFFLFTANLEFNKVENQQSCEPPHPPFSLFDKLESANWDCVSLFLCIKPSCVAFFLLLSEGSWLRLTQTNSWGSCISVVLQYGGWSPAALRPNTICHLRLSLIDKLKVYFTHMWSTFWHIGPCVKHGKQPKFSPFLDHSEFTLFSGHTSFLFCKDEFCYLLSDPLICLYVFVESCLCFETPKNALFTVYKTTFPQPKVKKKNKQKSRAKCVLHFFHLTGFISEVYLHCFCCR